MTHPCLRQALPLPPPHAASAAAANLCLKQILLTGLQLL
jgi:hypothetical protein